MDTAIGAREVSTYVAYPLCDASRWFGPEPSSVMTQTLNQVTGRGEICTLIKT
jgi:hypothetical protein